MIQLLKGVQSKELDVVSPCNMHNAGPSSQHRVCFIFFTCLLLLLWTTLNRGTESLRESPPSLFLEMLFKPGSVSLFLLCTWRKCVRHSAFMVGISQALSHFAYVTVGQPLRETHGRNHPTLGVLNLDLYVWATGLHKITYLTHLKHLAHRRGGSSMKSYWP